MRLEFVEELARQAVGRQRLADLIETEPLVRTQDADQEQAPHEVRQVRGLHVIPERHGRRAPQQPLPVGPDAGEIRRKARRNGVGVLGFHDGGLNGLSLHAPALRHGPGRSLDPGQTASPER
jgi:hypothetical protein